MTVSLLTHEELPWLGAIIDSEAAVYNSSAKRGFKACAVRIVSSDRDVIDSVAKAVGAGTVADYKHSKTSFAVKPCWSWTLYGDLARWLLGLVYKFLSERRHAQIENVVQ